MVMLDRWHHARAAEPNLGRTPSAYRLIMCCEMDAFSRIAVCLVLLQITGRLAGWRNLCALVNGDPRALPAAVLYS